jgi:hypothetical protein
MSVPLLWQSLQGIEAAVVHTAGRKMTKKMGDHLEGEHLFHCIAPNEEKNES